MLTEPLPFTAELLVAAFTTLLLLPGSATAGLSESTTGVTPATLFTWTSPVRGLPALSNRRKKTFSWLIQPMTKEPSPATTTAEWVVPCRSAWLTRNSGPTG